MRISVSTIFSGMVVLVLFHSSFLHTPLFAISPRPFLIITFNFISPPVISLSSKVLNHTHDLTPTGAVLSKGHCHGILDKGLRIYHLMYVYSPRTRIDFAGHVNVQISSDNLQIQVKLMQVNTSRAVCQIQCNFTQ